VYQWNFEVAWQFREAYLKGAGVTLALSLYSLVFALLAGLFIALARQSRTRLLSLPASWYVEILRDTPILVQFVWIFYCLPILLGIKMTAFWSSVLALSLHFSAYVAEIVRAGIASIDEGQIDAAKVLGMTYAQTMRRIVLPQAFRRMIPPLVNNFADIMKLSALASVIGVDELLHIIDNVNMNTFRPLELYSVLAVVYFLLIFPVALGARHVERHLSRKL
jgi:polar amino acid transport system permease protein